MPTPRKGGARVVHVHNAGNSIPLERFADAIDEQTKLVAITHVCYRNGVMNDVPAIVEIAHRKGALVLLDAYQSLGTMPIDVKQLGVDFLVGGTLKYLLASSGMAYLYVRKELLPTLDPTAVGWFTQANIFAMNNDAHIPSPRRANLRPVHRRCPISMPPWPVSNWCSRLVRPLSLRGAGVDRSAQREPCAAAGISSRRSTRIATVRW
ncbi:MAG: aminotransferase class V-fold PLP-dependent enzyme [Caldilineaceae bacterium]